MRMTTHFNLLPAATKLGLGNVFTGVCDSVHGGLCASVHAVIPPARSRHPPGADIHPLPKSRQPPPPAYSQQVAGMHPTGMHSC